MRNEKGEIEITDRELIGGLYNLLGAMCRRLFGETPSIHLDIGNGDWYNFVSGDWRIKWIRDAGGKRNMSAEVMLLGGGTTLNSTEFTSAIVALSNKSWCRDIFAWEKPEGVIGLVIQGYSEKWKMNFTCTTSVATQVFEDAKENPVEFIEKMVLESDAETPQN